MGDVLTFSPSSKFGEPVIFPDMEPSRFCFQFVMVGTPRGAAETILGGTWGVLGA